MKYIIKKSPGGFAGISDDFSGLNYNNITGLGGNIPVKHNIKGKKSATLNLNAIPHLAPVSSPSPVNHQMQTVTTPTNPPSPPSLPPNPNMPVEPIITVPSDTVPLDPTTGQPISSPTGGGGSGGGDSTQAADDGTASTDASAAKVVTDGAILHKSCIPHYVLAGLIGTLGGHYVAKHYKKNVWGGTLTGGSILLGGMIWWCHKYHHDTLTPAVAPTPAPKA